MACEIMIHRNSSNYSNPNAELDRQGVYKKGYIVGGRTLPHAGWGNQERFEAGKFVFIKITDADWSEFEGYDREWELEIDYQKMGEDLTTDGHRFSIFSTNPGLSFRGAITREKAENWLNNWNVTIHSTGLNEITIDCIIWEMLKSKGFWDRPEGLQGLTANEDSYNQTTGEHVISINWSNYLPNVKRSMLAKNFQHRIEERGGEIITFDLQSETGTFKITRNDVLLWFRQEVYYLVRKFNVIYRRKFYLPEATVDQLTQYSANNNNEPYEATKAEFINYVESMLDKENA